MIRRLHLQQPENVGQVAELAVAGFVGRWFRSRHWAGFTLPLPFLAVIFYWVGAETEDPSPFVRVHEMHHAAQIRRWGFLGFGWRYLTGLRHGYESHPLELAAYDVEGEARLSGLPTWAR